MCSLLRSRPFRICDIYQSSQPLHKLLVTTAWRPGQRAAELVLLDQRRRKTQCKFNIKPALLTSPTIVTDLNSIDTAIQDISINVYTTNVANTGSQMHLDSLLNSVFAAGATWLELPQNDTDFATGSFTAASTGSVTTAAQFQPYEIQQDVRCTANSDCVDQWLLQGSSEWLAHQSLCDQHHHNRLHCEYRYVG